MYYVAERVKTDLFDGDWKIPADCCFRSLNKAKAYIRAKELESDLEYMIVKEYGAMI